MARSRISTTVDNDLLETARSLRSGLNDAKLIDEALAALLSIHRSAQIDSQYSSYDKKPIDTNDDWGNLESFREAASNS